MRDEPFATRALAAAGVSSNVGEILKWVNMGLKDFLKTIEPEPEVLQAIRAQAKRNKTSKLTSRQIDQEITAYRRERRLSKRRS